MDRTAVVITDYMGDCVIPLENITSLDIINTGTSIVEVNGLKVSINERVSLIVPDGTVSDIKLEAKYPNNNNAANRFTLIYKKIKQ